MAPSWEFSNFRNCCRLCLSEQGTLTNMFSGKQIPGQLPKKIMSVIGIKVAIQDRVTTSLCDKCFLNLNNFYLFKNSCLINQVKLAEQLSIYEASLHDESIIIKDEPMSDDECVFVSPESERPLLVKTETQNVPSPTIDDELPPILSPNLPTADMLRNLEIPVISMARSNGHTESDIEVIQSQPGSSQETQETQGEACEQEDSLSAANESTGHKVTRPTRILKKLVENFKAPAPVVATPLTPRRSANDSREKIDFAATLQLAKKQDNVNLEPFTQTEIQYEQRMRIIYTQIQDSHCACHNKMFVRAKGLMNHIKGSGGVYLPPYTCHHCVTTFVDRSWYSQHRSHRCKAKNFERMHDVSNVTERGINKHRNYQSFKCKLCLCTTRLFETFVQHVDEHFMYDPYLSTCHCGKQFNTSAFKQHMLSSCVMKPSCDMCDIMFDTVNEFKTHCTAEHDDKFGEVFRIADGYAMRELPFAAMYACVECNLKCRQELFMVRHLQKEHAYDLDTAKRSGEDCYIGPGDEEADTPPIPPSKIVKKPTVLNNNRVDTVPAAVTEAQMDQRKSPRKPTSLPLEMEEQPRVDVPEVIQPRNNSQKQVKKTTDEIFIVSAFKQLDPASYECQVCFKIFSNPSNVRRHIINAHFNHSFRRNSSFSCANCNARFTTMQVLKDHFMSFHFNTCGECGKKCDNFEELDKHRSSHLRISLTRDPNTHNYRAQSGNETNLNEVPLLTSIDAEDRKALKVCCVMCHKLFATTRGLSVHMRRSHNTALNRDEISKFPHRCRKTGCYVLLNTPQDWSMHMQMHAEADTNSNGSDSSALDDYFTCGKCFKNFANRGNYKQHLKTHGCSPSKSKKHICTICKMNCGTAQQLAKHKEEHLRTLKHKANTCKHCKLVFLNDGELQMHLHSEHGISAKVQSEDQTVFECEYCGKKLKSAHSYRGHIGWHRRPSKKSLEEEPPMLTAELNEAKLAGKGTMKSSCVTCGKQFPTPNALQDHISIAHVKTEVKTQSQAKRQLTSQVSQSLAKKSKKGYEYCKICGDEFNAEDELIDHMKRKHPTVPYVSKGSTICDICADEFRTMAALKSHMRMHERRGEIPKTPSAPKKAQVVILPKPADASSNVQDKESTKTFKFNCGICQKGYELGPDLRRHILAAHPF